jgi:hypothetical protein
LGAGQSALPLHPQHLAADPLVASASILRVIILLTSWLLLCVLLPGSVFVDVHRWDSEEVHNVRLSSSAAGIESMEPAVRLAFNVPVEQACKVYYLTDRQRPRQTKQKVHDAESWRGFWALRTSSAEHIGLHLHVTPRASPGSREKEPSWLKIDTGRKRANMRQGSTPSSAALDAAATPSGNPGDVQTLRSPLLRDSTLYRDFDEAENLSYCVFCHVCYDADALLKTAQLIPRAVSERFGLEVSQDLLAMIGGYYETTLNAVTACRLCHPLFDNGLLWLDSPAAASAVAAASSAAAASALLPISSLVLHIDASLRCDFCKSLGGVSLRLPGLARAHLPFPPLAAWEWRARWASLKRQDELAKAISQLTVDGPCDSKEE